MTEINAIKYHQHCIDFYTNELKKYDVDDLSDVAACDRTYRKTDWLLNKISFHAASVEKLEDKKA